MQALWESASSESASWESALWESALAILRSRLAEENFRTWLEPVELERIDGRTLVLRIPNRFYADWLSAHYADVILAALRQACEERDRERGEGAESAELPVAERPVPQRPVPQRVEWKVDERIQKRLDEEARAALRESERATRELHARAEARAASTPGSAHPAGSMRPAPQTVARGAQGSLARGSLAQGPLAQGPGASAESASSAAAAQAESGLSPKYRFDNFIVGPSNQLAHAASIAAASSPGTRYNPLFIYGGVGLGKTHLVNAIGHRIRQDRPDARVLFLSAERFTNEFIWALQNHRINEFRERYRSRCDVLCIDDIQFLAGREQTQEEFFHTFNALYHADRQIVVTSDVYPQQIKEMEERLVSRFQWGLVADIQAPELDTRIAILKKKAEQEQIGLANDVALLIAQEVQSNVRELEGTLLRLAVKAELTGKDLGLDFAREALGTQQPRMDKQATVEDVQRAACEYFNVRLAELKSHRRHRAVSFPRMVAMYICRQRLKLSYPELGDRFGGKDHTTVISAVRKIGGLVDQDEQVRGAVSAIERKIGWV
jgi:chromosomal replication initiator protein